MRSGQKSWKLGSDVEHEECIDHYPASRLPQLRAALRHLNRAPASLVALGKFIVERQLHRQPNVVPASNDAEIARIAAELKRAVVELERNPDERERG